MTDPQRAARRNPNEPASTRLPRLLALVPWLLARPGVAAEEAAREFRISTDQLVADLELLFVCGLPGGMPDDLIDADWTDGRVFVSNADEISRPLRLTGDEVVGLLVGLRTLIASPGVTELDAATRALAKLEAVAEGLGAAAGLISVQNGPMTDGSDIAAAQLHQAQVLATARSAMKDHRRVHLSYYVPGRDEVSERDVDLIRVSTLGPLSYLEGWCHRAEDVRTFRVNRVQSITVLDVDGTPPAETTDRDRDSVTDPGYTPGADDHLVVLDLAPSARWVGEYYPNDGVEHRDDGSVRVTLRAGDLGWVRRLVMRSAGTVVPVEPAELRVEVRRSTESALAAYT